MSLILPAKKKFLMAQKGGTDISEVFNTSLWTGTGAGRTITTGIDSDGGSLVWAKKRNVATTSWHLLFDTLRGAGNFLSSEQTSVQATQMAMLNAFSSNGYGLGTNGYINGSGDTYVGWQFRRTPKFFDIVTYSGDTVNGRAIPHNLGTTPGLILVKCTTLARDWIVYHRSTGASQYLSLNLTAAAYNINRWGSTEPTSINFYVSGDADVNVSGHQYVAYLFAHDPSPEGIIQCGSYVGNGSATGPVVNLGWRPQYLMIKAATTTSDWSISDTVRGIPGSNNPRLRANTSDAEVMSNGLALTATGFELLGSASAYNTNGQTYIYMAIRGVT